MARWMLLVVAGFLVVYCATALIAGDPAYAIPGAILLALVIGYAALERILTRVHLRRHGGDPGRALSDHEDWAVPSAHLTPDDERPTGDTPEVHDEISPHDLPPDHPGREAAEAQAAEAEAGRRAEDGAGGRFERRRDRTGPRPR